MVTAMNEACNITHNKKKTLYIEVIRIIAIIFVVYTHTGSNGYLLFTDYPDTSIRFWMYMLVSIFIKSAVPLFMMISGALLLDKDESLSVIWKKRILRITIVLIIVSFIYYLESLDFDLRRINVSGFLKAVYSSNVKYHLWYLYSYIAFLICLPQLRSLAKNLEDKYFIYILVINIICNLIPIAEYFIWNGKTAINSNIKVTWLLTQNMVSPLLGYYIDKRMKLKGKYVALLWLVTIFLIIISGFATFTIQRRTETISTSRLQKFFKNIWILTAFTVFVTVKHLFTNNPQMAKVPRLLKWIIIRVGSNTFIIYLIHVMIKDLKPMRALLQGLIKLGIGRWPSVWIYVITTVIICSVIAEVLKLLPRTFGYIRNRKSKMEIINADG